MAIGSLAPVEDVEKESTPVDPDLVHYRTAYLGMTRGKLKDVNPQLYAHLWRKGLLDEVPTTARNIGDPIDYYRLHYEGLTQQDLYNVDRSLYQLLHNNAQLHLLPQRKPKNAPKEKKTVEKPKPPSVDELLAHYHERYDGLTRSQLFLKDNAFYFRLRRRQLLHLIPLKEK